jgi:hypothetical protein
MASIGTEVSRYSQILGVSKEQVVGLDLLAKASGGSIEELATAYGRFSKNVADGIDEAKRALSAIGVSFEAVKARNPERQLEPLADRFSKFADGSGKAAAANMLFGRSGIQLIPIMNQGAEGIRHWFEVAQDLEPALARNVEGMEAMHRAELEMETSWRGLKIEIWEHFASALTGVAKEVRDLAAWFTKAAEEGDKADLSTRAWLDTFKELEIAFDIGKLAITELWSTFVLGASLAGDAVNEVVTQLQHLWHLDFSGAKEEWKFWGDYIKGEFKSWSDDIVAQNKATAARIREI